MKYIRIKNKGLIDPKALHLLGASTKVNDASKIGQFGSGNKYALAYFLRNDYELKVFSGDKEIVIETKKETFRDQSFEIICIDGEKTSITTSMGKDWKFWQAIREVYCNALDEGESSLDFVHAISPNEKETHFYIDTKKDVVEFVQNFDNYFATKKKVLFECENGRILEKSGTEANIYRKGIKCLNCKNTSLYDYDFNHLSVGEDRLAMSKWEVEEKMWDLIFRCTDKEIILNILSNCGDSKFIEGNLLDYSDINASVMSDDFKRCIKTTNLAPKGYAGLLKDDEVHRFLIIPTKIYKSFQGFLSDKNIADSFNVTISGAMFREVKMVSYYKTTIDKALEFFKEVDFQIDYPIKVAVFDDKKILGCAYKGEIILSIICLEKGVNEVVNTMIEEFIHLKYNVGDQTRGFQTSIITEFISYMKKKNSFIV